MRSLYEQLYPGVYVPSSIELTARQRAEAAWLWSDASAPSVAGTRRRRCSEAKWVDGTAARAELMHDNRQAAGSSSSCAIRDDCSSENARRSTTCRVTTPARTAFDIGRSHCSHSSGVQRLDALANATVSTSRDVEVVSRRHPGVQAVCDGLRALAAGSTAVRNRRRRRSTRLALIDAGLPATANAVRGVRRDTATSSPASDMALRGGAGRHRVRRVAASLD